MVGVEPDGSKVREERNAKSCFTEQPGLFQLAVTLMPELSPGKRVASTAFITLSSSIAFIVIPYVTGLIARYIGVFNLATRKRMMDVNTARCINSIRQCFLVLIGNML